LIQSDFNAAKITTHLESLLEGPQREQQLQDYSQLETLLGEAGASERVAEKVVRSVRDGKVG
jgi:lipid-A-disaccharide synthase